MANRIKKPLRRKKRRGMSLTEIVVCLIIVAIVAAVGVGFGGKQISDSRMQTIANNLKVIQNDVESAIVDLGFLNEEDVQKANVAKNYFTAWDSRYTTCPLDIENMVLIPKNNAFTKTDENGVKRDYAGAIIPTKEYPDPWGNELQIFYFAPVDPADYYRIIIASAGPNGKWAADAANGYINTVFEDDVLLMMEPRI